MGLTTLAANEGNHGDFVLFFLSVFQKSEGKLSFGLANSLFSIYFNFYNWFTNCRAKIQVFSVRSQMFHLPAFHANHGIVYYWTWKEQSEVSV